MKEEIEYNLRKIQRIPIIVKGLQAYSDQLEDSFIYSGADPVAHEKESNSALESIKATKVKISEWTEMFEESVRYLEDHGVDPFPVATSEKIKIEDELMQQFPFLKRTRRAGSFVWFWKLLHRNKK